MIWKIGSAIDLERFSFVDDPKKILAIDRQKTCQHDLAPSHQVSDQPFDLFRDRPAFRLPEVSYAATSDDPGDRRREGRRIHIQQVMSIS